MVPGLVPPWFQKVAFFEIAEIRKASHKISLVPGLVPLGSAMSASRKHWVSHTVFHRISLVPGLVPPGSKKLQFWEIVEMREASYQINLVPDLVPLGSAMSESGNQCIPQTIFRRSNLVSNIASSSLNQICVGSVASPPCSLAWLLAAAAPRR